MNFKSFQHTESPFRFRVRARCPMARLGSQIIATRLGSQIKAANRHKTRPLLFLSHTFPSDLLPSSPCVSPCMCVRMCVFVSLTIATGKPQKNTIMRIPSHPARPRLFNRSSPGTRVYLSLTSFPHRPSHNLQPRRGCEQSIATGCHLHLFYISKHSQSAR